MKIDVRSFTHKAGSGLIVQIQNLEKVLIPDKGRFLIRVEDGVVKFYANDLGLFEIKIGLIEGVEESK